MESHTLARGRRLTQRQSVEAPKFNVHFLSSLTSGRFPPAAFRISLEGKTFPYNFDAQGSAERRSELFAGVRMHGVTVWIALVSGYVFSRIAEVRMHRINLDFLSLAGGQERIPGTMRWYYRLVFLALPLALLEYAHHGYPTLARGELLAGAGLVVTAWGLRLWAIHALGRLWAMGCISLPGAPLIRRGPYRFSRHPEYFTRLLDGAGLCLALGAHMTALAYLLVTALVTLRILGTERQELGWLVAEKHEGG